MTLPAAAARHIESAAAQTLADLTRLVAIPTGGGHAAGLDECRGILNDRLAKLAGPAVRTELVAGDPRPAWLDHSGNTSRDSAPPPTAIIRTPGDSGRVLLCGHIDTVHDPAGAFRELTIDSSGTRALGPGAADMKGGILIAVLALEALAAAGIRGPWTFVLNSDEETGSYCSDRALRRAASIPGTLAGLVFEPALPDGSLVIRRPGSGQFVLTAQGKAAHVGRDFTSGKNAIAALSQAVLDITAHADASAGRIVNVGVIRGGSATNIVPDAATAWGNVRYDSPEAEQRLAAALDALNTADLPRVAVERSFARPAKPTTPAVEKLALLARSAAEELGQKLPFGTTGGVCDGNNLQAAGIPVIDTLGVRGGGLHTTDEWIEIPSLAERAKLAASLIAKLWEGRLA